MQLKSRTIVASAGAALLLAGASVWAQPAHAPAEVKPRPAPQEAIDACSGKTAGAAVTLTLKGRDGSSRALEATCQKGADGVLVARPERAPDRPLSPQKAPQ
ncbi:MAG: hypothetical protein LBP52_03925 [Burkholderiaceae bacterium]|jgi:hypothetical protein|nr:hypothetical protein [Burkholderiaceae bacterium]